MGRRMRVLLVEDEPVDVMTIERAIRQRALEGAVEVAESAECAIERLGLGSAGVPLAESELPELILADLRLPLLSGLDLLERLKANERLRSIPVVMLSTSKQERDVSRAYALGAAGYVVKPLDFDHYADALEKILSYWQLAEPRASTHH